MKQAIQIKLLILGLLLIVITACSFAQQGFDTNLFKSKLELKHLNKKSLKLDLSIHIDAESIKDSIYVLKIKNLTTNIITSINVTDKFVLFLDYSNEYELTISHPQSNQKIIMIDTNCKEDEDWYILANIELTKKSDKAIYAGLIKYDRVSNTFKKYNQRYE